jgi:glucan biosynthesis protein C
VQHPVVLSIGYFVVQWNLPIAAKYGAIAGISFVIIMALYEFLVRRFKATRFLFGMKLRQAKVPAYSLAQVITNGRRPITL